MKTLLLTDIPPSHSYTAGLVTAQICRALKPGELAAFVILNGELRPEPAEDLAWIPTAFSMKPPERGVTRLGSYELGEVAAFVHETRTRIKRTRGLIGQAIRFGREQNVDQVWAILQGQTMVRVSRRVARGLRVPLKTQIWDPLSWWHRAWGVDRINRFLDDREWSKTLRQSEIVASASPAMSRYIKEHFGTESIPIIAAVDVAVSFEAAANFVNADEFIIGMAGQFYALESWKALCEALGKREWCVGGRKVVLRVMGGSPPPNVVPEGHLRYHGWLEQTDAIGLLASSCDVLYCPYPFAEDMAEVSRLSFPSKIVIYLASGRPIFFHGPDYSSPRDYLADRGAAVICESLESEAILTALERFAREPGLYGTLAAAGRRAFLRDFTADRQRELVEEFIRAGTTKKPLVSSVNERETQDLEEAFDSWYYLRSVESARAYPGNIIEHYRRSGWRAHNDPNAWFFVQHYLDMNPDVAQSGIEPLTHYLKHGWREARDPNPWFSTRYYLEQNPDVRRAGLEPFRHYREYGWREGRDPAPWFSTRRYGDFRAGSGIQDPLTHYVRLGWREGREPNDWFSPRWYLDRNPDIVAANIEPLQHYLRHGWREGRNPNPWFSVRHYISSNPDVVSADIEPIAHYWEKGWREDRDPNEWFSVKHFLSQRPDLRESDIEPCTFYLRQGWREEVDPNEWFSVKYYVAHNPEIVSAGFEPLTHYLEHGWREGRDPNDRFSVRYYLASNPDVAAAQTEPVAHYRRVGRLEGRPVRPPALDEGVRLTDLAEQILTRVALTIEGDLSNPLRLPPASPRSHFTLLHAVSLTTQEWLADEFDELVSSRHGSDAAPAKIADPGLS